MKNILWKIFPPYEVSLTQKELDSFLSKNAGNCLESIRSEIVSLIKDSEKTVYSIRIDNIKPEHLALLLTTNVIGNHISSGRYHVYRGLLGGQETTCLNFGIRPSKQCSIADTLQS